MKTIAVLVAITIALTVLLAGCRQNIHTACNGHGHSIGYESGQVKCSDGSWQRVG